MPGMAPQTRLCPHEGASAGQPIENIFDTGKAVSCTTRIFLEASALKEKASGEPSSEALFNLRGSSGHTQ